MHIRTPSGYNPDKKSREREARVLAEIEDKAGNFQPK